MNLYRKILKNALVVTLRYKYLWFFGLFSSLMLTSGEYEVFFSMISGGGWQEFIASLSVYKDTGILNLSVIKNFFILFQNDPINAFVILLVFIIILILLIFFVWLMIVSQIALVDASANLISSKRKKLQTIKDGVAAGVNNFWQVLGLNLVMKIFIALAFVIVGSLVFLVPTNLNSPLFGLTYGLLFLIFMPLAIVFSLIIKYAIAYVVIQGKTFVESIKSGWELFLSNWLVSVEMALLLFFISSIIILLVSAFISLLLVPLLSLAILMYQAGGPGGFLIVALLSFFLFSIIYIFIRSLLSVFHISAWTNLFIELNGKGISSKIVRMVDVLRNN